MKNELPKMKEKCMTVATLFTPRGRSRWWYMVCVVVGAAAGVEAEAYALLAIIIVAACLLPGDYARQSWREEAK